MRLKGNKTAAAQPAWRPDFRVRDRLPDLKVVRTGFIFNVGSVLLAVALVGTLAYREYTAFTLNSRVARLNEQVDGLAAQDRKNIADSGEFLRKMTVAEEAVSFRRTPIEPAHLLMELSRLQPQEGRFTSLDIRESTEGQGPAAQLTYRISLQGAMAASGTRKSVQLIDDYIRAIRESEVLAPYMRRVELASAERKADIEQFLYTVVIDLNATEAPKS